MDRFALSKCLCVCVMCWQVFSWGSCAIQVGVLLHHSDDLLGLRQDGKRKVAGCLRRHLSVLSTSPGRHSFLLEHYPPAETAGVFCGMQRASLNQHGRHGLALFMFGVARRNLLLNAGPTADGRILPIFEERLTQMGAWLSINGEAIYGNVPWRVQNDTVDRNTWYTASKVRAIIKIYPESGLYSNVYCQSAFRQLTWD